MSETVTTNSPESNIPENWELRDKDPAANLVDGARAFRESIYASGATPEQMDSMFKDDGSGVAGAPELMKLIARMREKGNPTLGTNEFAFTKHMGVEKNYHDAMGAVDWEKFAAKGKEASGNDTIHSGAAYREGYNWVIADLEQKLVAVTDLDEQSALEDKIDLITSLRDIETTSLAHKSGPGTVEAKFVGTLIEKDSAAPDKMDDYNAALGGMKAELADRDKQTSDVVAALKILSEDYSDEFGRTPSADALDDDPTLEYVDPTAPEPAPAAPTPPTPPTPPAPTGPRPMNEKEIQFMKATKQEEFISLRNKVAGSRATFGKRFNDMFLGGDNDVNRVELERQYKEMSREMAEEKYPWINDPSAPAELRETALAKFIMDEQVAMRAEYKEKLDNTAVAKIGKWIGNHKVLVVAGLTILAPITMGTSLGFGATLAGGLLGASKMDEFMRGRGIGDSSSITMQDMKNYLAASSGDFDSAHDFAKADFENESKKEMRNRTLAVGATGLFSAMFVGNAAGYPGAMTLGGFGKGAVALGFTGIFSRPKKKKKKDQARH